jgi:hypothetical protein
MFEVEPRTCQQSAKKEKKNIVSLKVIDFIHYKEFLMLL